jgi:hypothetical protein
MTTYEPAVYRDLCDEIEALRQELAESRDNCEHCGDMRSQLSAAEAERDSLAATVAVLAQDRDERRSLAERMVVEAALGWRASYVPFRGALIQDDAALIAAVDVLDGT